MYYSMECLRENGKYTPEFGSDDLDDVVFEMDTYREDGETVRMTAHPNPAAAQRHADWLIAEHLKSETPEETVERLYPYNERRQEEILLNIMDQE